MLPDRQFSRPGLSTTNQLRVEVSRLCDRKKSHKRGTELNWRIEQGVMAPVTGFTEYASAVHLTDRPQL